MVLVLNPPENLTINQFNDFSSDQKQNSDNIRNCKYYNTHEILSVNKLNDKHSPGFPTDVENKWGLFKV